MIEDAIMDVLADSQRAWDAKGLVMWINEMLDAEYSDVERAIIVLEEQGKVRGYFDDNGAPMIEAVA